MLLGDQDTHPGWDLQSLTEAKPCGVLTGQDGGGAVQAKAEAVLLPHLAGTPASARGRVHMCGLPEAPLHCVMCPSPVKSHTKQNIHTFCAQGRINFV